MMDEAGRLALIRGGLLSGGGLLVTAFVPLAFPGFATVGAIAGVGMLLVGVALTLPKVVRRRGRNESGRFPAQLTLRQHFERDFPQLNLRREANVMIGSHAVPFSLQCHIDFTAGSDFVSIYIPTNVKSFAAAALLAREVRLIRSELTSNAPITVREPGAYTESKSMDVVFTGKVYLYHEDHYTPRQIADLIDAYQEQELQLEPRGHTYRTVRWLSSSASA